MNQSHEKAQHESKARVGSLPTFSQDNSVHPGERQAKCVASWTAQELQGNIHCVTVASKYAAIFGDTSMNTRMANTKEYFRYLVSYQLNQLFPQNHTKMLEEVDGMLWCFSIGTGTSSDSNCVVLMSPHYIPDGTPPRMVDEDGKVRSLYQDDWLETWRCQHRGLLLYEWEHEDPGFAKTLRTAWVMDEGDTLRAYLFDCDANRLHRNARVLSTLSSDLESSRKPAANK